MPYIVTTKRLERIRVDMPRNIEVIDPRRAVATLEEAQDHAVDAVADIAKRGGLSHDYGDAINRARQLPESGGTITLPDGTVIEVEPCDRFWLLRELGRDEHSADTVDEIVDAYNAAQS